MTLKRKVFFQALLLLLLCDLLSSGISFVVSKQLITDQIIASKKSELLAIDDRIRDTYSIVREKQELLADDYDLRAKLTPLAGKPATSYEKSEQIDRVLDRLSVELYHMGELQSLNVLAGGWLIGKGTTDWVVYDEATAGRDMSDIEETKLEALRLLARSHTGQKLQPEHIIVTRVSSGVYLIGALEFGELISDQRMMIEIRNKERLPVYRQNGAADSEAEMERSTSYLEIQYSLPHSDFEYSLWMNDKEIEAKFRKPLFNIILFSLFIFVIFGAILYWNTDRLLRPINAFSSLLTHIEHVSHTDEIDRFILQYQRRAGMRTRLYVYFSLGIIPLFIVILANFVLFRDVVLTEARTKDYGTIREIRSNVEYRMESYSIFLKKLSLDPAIQQEMITLAASAEPLGDNKDMSDLLLNKGILTHHIRYIRFYDDNYRLIYTSDNWERPAPTNVAWRQALSNKFATYFWDAVNEETDEARRLVLYGKVKYVPQPGRETRAFQQIGYIEMAMQPFFDEKIQLSAERSNRILYLFDRSAKLIYSSNPYEYETERSVRAWLESTGFGDGGMEFETHSANGMTIADSAVRASDWRFVYVMPSKGYATSNVRILTSSLIVVLMLLLFALTLSELLIKQILRPMAKLIRLMDGLETQKLNHLTLYLGDNEFAHMARNFKNMLNRLHSMSEDIKEKELERFELEKRKKDAKLTALQSQMNPHFLYNIFTSIHLLVKIKQNDKASEMIQATGKLLRFGLYRGNQIIRVAEELEHVGAYIRIQEIRYNSRVKVVQQYEEGIESYKMPKFLLQPLVENAFEHASSQDRALTLIVRLNADGDDRLLISVEDDGVGIPGNKLASIQGRLAHLTPSDHIGLLNVHERIQLFYGAQYGLGIESEYGSGTTVTLTLPLVKEA
jgi:sensor histidine kinase YesM